MIRRITVWDLECTGETPEDGGIVEIGYATVMACDSDLYGRPCNWNAYSGIGQIVNPHRPISPETMAVHFITDEDVKFKPRWEDVHPHFFPEVPEEFEYPNRAHAAFGMEYEKAWLEPYFGDLPLICVYKASLRVWPNAPRHKNQVLRFWRNPKGLIRKFAEPAHRAAPDAYVTAHLLRDILNEGVSVDDLIEWTKSPALLPVCRIGKWRNGGAGTPWSEIDDGFLIWMLDKEFDENTLYTARVELERREKERAGNTEIAEYDYID